MDILGIDKLKTWLSGPSADNTPHLDVDVSAVLGQPELGGYSSGIESVIGTEGDRFWDGEPLQHVYRKQRGYDIDSCPKCNGDLTNYYVGLVYGSHRELRQHMSPCAYVCNPCNVVVLDEALPRGLAKLRGYPYTAPVGIYSLKRPAPPTAELDFFKTYEGRETIFVLDARGYFEDIVYKDGGSLGFTIGQVMPSVESHRRKAKRKAEKSARKKNRRH
jgi:hypothetical protein